VVTYSAVLRDCCALFTYSPGRPTRSRRPAGLLRTIYTIALEHNVHLHAVHRAGVDNVLADSRSRPSLRGARSDSESVLRRWQQLYRAAPALCARLSCVCVLSTVGTSDLELWAVIDYAFDNVQWPSRSAARIRPSRGLLLPSDAPFHTSSSDMTWCEL